MDEPLQKWIYKTAHRNLWRVYPLLTFQELVQEGMLVYSKLRIKYPHVTQARHMMQLMVRSYTNHIHDIANKRRTSISTWAIYDVDGIETWLENQPCEHSELMLCIAEAPPHVNTALRAMLAPENQQAWHSPWKRYADGKRETFNERLARLTGLPTWIDLQTEIRAYLKDRRSAV